MYRAEGTAAAQWESAKRYFTMGIPRGHSSSHSALAVACPTQILNRKNIILAGHRAADGDVPCVSSATPSKLLS